MTKNKKLIIILVVIVIIDLLVIGLIISQNRRNNPTGTGNQTGNTRNLPAPEFLGDAEKLELGLAPAQKIQAWRDANGKITTYKVIKSEADIILDPAAIAPISPRQKPVVK